MKLRDFTLTESPYLHSGYYSVPDVESGETFYSDSALSRRELLFEAQVIFAGKKTPLRFFRSSDIQIVGVIPEIDNQYGEKSNLMVYQLAFKKKHTIEKYPSGITPNKVLQVTSVFCNENIQDVGISSTVYMKLVEMGHVIVSDSAQFIPGKQLWMRLSRIASSEGMMVRAFDSETGELLTDDDSLPSKLWTSDQDLSGEFTLLMLARDEKG